MDYVMVIKIWDLEVALIDVNQIMLFLLFFTKFVWHFWWIFKGEHAKLVLHNFEKSSKIAKICEKNEELVFFKLPTFKLQPKIPAYIFWLLKIDFRYLVHH